MYGVPGGRSVDVGQIQEIIYVWFLGTKTPQLDGLLDLLEGKLANGGLQMIGSCLCMGSLSSGFCL